MGGRALAIATAAAAAATAVTSAAATSAARGSARPIAPSARCLFRSPPPTPSTHCLPVRSMSSSGDPSIKQRKAALRKEVASRLQALDDAYIVEQSRRLFARLLDLPAVAGSRCLSVYLSMPSKEVPTYPQLVGELMQGERTVYVPKVTGPASPDMVMLCISSPDDVAAFPKSKWGIPEPPLPDSFEKERDDGTYAGQMDLVLVPGVAFDAQCRRLGHGKGYYDCFLARLGESNAAKGGPRPYTVGLALGEQVIDGGVPTDAFDRPLDAVVTPDRVYLREGGDGSGE